MKQKIIIFFIIIFSAIFQSTFFFNSFFEGVGPDIVLLLVIFWTAHEGFERVLFRNIMIGFVFDVVTFSIIGTHISALALVAFFVSFISKRFLVVASNWRICILGITIIFGTLANNIFLNGLFLVMNYFSRIEIGNVPIPLFSLVMLKAVLLNVLFFLPIYFILKKIERNNLLKKRTNIA